MLPRQKREQHGSYDLLAFDEDRAQFGFDCAQLTERFIDGCRIGHYEWLRLIVIDDWWGPDQLSRPRERNRSFFAARTVSARKKLSSICGQSRSKASGSTPGWELKRLRANSFQYVMISSTKATRSAVSGVLAGIWFSSIAVPSSRHGRAARTSFWLEISSTQSSTGRSNVTRHGASSEGAFRARLWFARAVRITRPNRLWYSRIWPRTRDFPQPRFPARLEWRPQFADPVRRREEMRTARLTIRRRARFNFRRPIVHASENYLVSLPICLAGVVGALLLRWPMR